MKKMLLTALLGLGCMLGTVSNASAWSKWSWGIGMSGAYEGGGNTVLWGLLKGSQIPCPGYADGGAPPMPAPMHGAAPAPAGPQGVPASLPRIEAQRVGYFQPEQYEAAQQQAPTYAVPSYWYDR
jgi:hypothetical protein